MLWVALVTTALVILTEESELVDHHLGKLHDSLVLQPGKYKINDKYIITKQPITFVYNYFTYNIIL